MSPSSRPTLALFFAALIACSAVVDVVEARKFPIKYWVVLMLENRSFDHLLGFLKKTHPGLDGLDGTESIPYCITDPTKGVVNVTSNAMFEVDTDPDHKFNATTFKIFAADGFNHNASEATMKGFFHYERYVLRHQEVKARRLVEMFTPQTAPIINTLAKEFAVFDRYYSSLPGPTNPNRQFFTACTTQGTVENKIKLTKGETIFSKVKSVGNSAAYYFHDAPQSADYNHKAHRPWPQFHKDAKAGRLPNFSWLEPRWTTDETYGGEVQCQHPTNGVPGGEALIKEVYERLVKSPQWNHTAFIITYDEHGGFYDHVPPPMNGVPNPDGKRGPANLGSFNFDRLGVRVPFVVVSPWIPKGHIEHEAQGPYSTSQYEHCSFAATLKKVMGWKGFISKRDKWAGTFEHIFSLSKPRTDMPKVLPPVARTMPSAAKRAGGQETETELDAVERAKNRIINDLQCDILESYGFKGDCNTVTEGRANRMLKKIYAYRRNKALHGGKKGKKSKKH